MNGEPRLFRLRPEVVLPTYLAYAQVIAATASLVMLGIAFKLTVDNFLRTYLSLSVICVIVAIVGSLRAIFLDRIEVGPEGIRARPGPVEPIYWDAIQTVRIKQWSVLSYLELETQKNRKHRFPLYLADLPGFVDAVEHFAGEDHPLTWALWEWLEME